jgi:hypothetical protein
LCSCWRCCDSCGRGGVHTAQLALLLPTLVLQALVSQWNVQFLDGLICVICIQACKKIPGAKAKKQQQRQQQQQQ